MKSSYYPPRAQLPSFALNAWFELRRAMRLERIHAPGGISLWRVMLSLLVPGYSFVATGRHHIGQFIMAAYVTGAIVFLILLGHAAANMIFGLMIGAHAISILWLLRLWVDRPPLWLKLAMIGTLVAFLGAALYWPCLQYAEERWFMPLSTSSGITIVQRGGAAETIRAGNVIAYRIESDNLENIRIREGFGVGRVLATAGARVEFFPEVFLIDGKPYTRKPGMPGQGSLVVPQNHWFLWPDIDIQLNGAATDVMATAALLHVAAVSQNNYVGKPYRHWFGRFQKVP